MTGVTPESSGRLSTSSLSRQLDPKSLEILRARGRGSLYFFIKGILGYDWLVPHIHKPMCCVLELYDGWRPDLSGSRDSYRKVLRKHFRLSDERIEEVLEKGAKRVMTVLPRGWLKSTICSIGYPLWRAVRNPEIRVLIVQNTHQNACKKLSSISSQVLENQLFRALYPELLPTKDSTWRAESLCLTRTKSHPEGTFEAAGTGTRVTSRHYELIIEDDTVAPDLDDLGVENLAPTKDEVDQAIGWHRLASPLLTNPETDQILIVGTRWFEVDLISWVRDNEKQYIHMTRACREDEDGKPSELGEITYPERFGPSVLDELKTAMGPYMFSCLYLNKPVRTGDMLFQPEWILTFDELPRRQLVTYTTLDPATDPAESKGKDLDYTVVMTTGKDLNTGFIYVLEYTRVRCSPGEMIAILFDHVRRWKPVDVGFEDVAFQKSLGYWIKERMRRESTWFSLRKINPHGRRKINRIASLQPLFSSGTIFIRPHHNELRNELLTFPLGAHDDIIDTLAMQLDMWRVTRTVKDAKDWARAEGAALSVDAAIEELQTKARREQTGGHEVSGTVLDLLYTATF